MTDEKISISGGGFIAGGGLDEGHKKLTEGHQPPLPEGLRFWAPGAAFPINKAAAEASHCFAENVSEREKHRRRLLAAFLTEFNLVFP